MVRTDLSRVLYRCACRSTLQCAYIYPSGPNFWSEALRSSWRRIVLRAFHVSNPTDKQAHIRWVCVQKREDRQGDSRRRIMAMAVKAMVGDWHKSQDRTDLTKVGSLQVRLPPIRDLYDLLHTMRGHSFKGPFLSCLHKLRQNGWNV